MEQIKKSRKSRLKNQKTTTAVVTKQSPKTKLIYNILLKYPFTQ